MPHPLIELNLLLPSFFLVLCRVSGIMLTAPLYGSTTIPARIKGATALAISAVMYPVLAPHLPQGLGFSAMLVGITGELAIGLLIGLGLSIILLATQMTGMIVGQQAGLALASAFDPNTQAQSSVIGQIYFFTATGLFLLIGGHRAMIGLIMDSFASVPVMSFTVNGDVVEVMVLLMISSLELSLKLAGPMILALLVAKATLGFLSRTIPQLHILSVGFALFVAIGMLMSGIEVNNLYDVFIVHLDEAFDYIEFALNIP